MVKSLPGYIIMETYLAHLMCTGAGQVPDDDESITYHQLNCV